MELLKPLSRLCVQDERQQSFVVITDPELHSTRERTLEDVYAEASDIRLVSSVPEKIQSHFSTALNLLAYSWFHYPFNVTAQFLAYVTVELALKEKFQPKKKTPLKKLIQQAVDTRLITASGFSHLEPTETHKPYLGVEAFCPDVEQYCRTLVDAMPYLRNELAHGSIMLHPNGSQAVRICADLINQLFAK